MDDPRIDLLGPFGAKITAEQTADDHDWCVVPVDHAFVGKVNGADQGDAGRSEVFEPIDLMNIFEPGETQKSQHNKSEPGAEISAVNCHRNERDTDEDEGCVTVDAQVALELVMQKRLDDEEYDGGEDEPGHDTHELFVIGVGQQIRAEGRAAKTGDEQQGVFARQLFEMLAVAICRTD